MAIFDAQTVAQIKDQYGATLPTGNRRVVGKMRTNRALHVRYIDEYQASLDSRSWVYKDSTLHSQTGLGDEYEPVWLCPDSAEALPEIQ